MSGLNPREIEKLILGYEELDSADRAQADEYLKGDPRLARRLKWHQDKEATAAAGTSLGDQIWEHAELSPEEQEAQRDSLRRILAQLPERASVGTGTGGHPGVRFTDHLRRPALWALPLAAILALAILLPRGGADPRLLKDLAVAQVQLLPDGSRGAVGAPGTGAELHTGEAFALDFYLNRPAYVVVYHVGPAGQVSRVYPDAITDTPSPHSGGQVHQIPDPASQEAWILGSETGPETFLVGTARNWPVGIADLSNGPNPEPRTQIIANLKRRLERLVDEVHLYEFEHVD